jgi:nicotinate phosphoribosyltransferase
MLKKFDQKVSEGILFTDQYQLVMAQLYFKMGLHERKVRFDHFFRNYPDYGVHKAGYCINAGLEWLIDWMLNTTVTDNDIELLANQKNSGGNPVFERDFLNWFHKNGNFSNITLKAIPEGRVIHPNVPLTVVEGPAAMAQILETALLNQLNYQILIATKACRINEAGRHQMLLEFGMRRAQDRGSNAGVRAALIGGADFSSNVGISHMLGYPPKGTHAHSMVQMFIALGMTEEDAFGEFASLYPADTILLVDTINTLESGVPNAIRVFEKMKRKGQKPLGIRLDSGDLAYLSIQTAKQLNDAGFEDVKIVLSNELDEMNIWQIITQITEEAPKYQLDPESIIKRLVYGVGTRLITSHGDPSLGGVYKLVAVTNQKDDWIPAIKISESAEKIPNPGNKKIWRIYNSKDKANADLITLDDEKPSGEEDIILHHATDQSKKRIIRRNQITRIEPLLDTILDKGTLVYKFPTIEEIRDVRKKDIESLDPGVKRLINPHYYHVSISEKLFDMKMNLIKSIGE